MKIKKITALIIAVIMLTAAIPFTAFAADEKEIPANLISEAPEYDGYPLIILPGINHSVSYLANDDGTPYLNSKGERISGGVVLVDTDGLVGKLIKKLLWPLLSSLILQCDNKLSDAAYDVVCDLLKLQSCDKEGNQIYNLKTDYYDYPVSNMDTETKKWFYSMLPIQKVTAKIGEDNVYLFTFPLVGDPMESAESLKDYIQMVKEQKNVDKVNIATVSLGGTILTSYAEITDDWSDINQIINVVSCLNGSDIFADFYARKWNLDADFLYRDYLRQIFNQNNGSPLLGSLLNMVIRIFSKDTVYALLTGAFSGVLDSLFINDAQFWAMMPKERYDELSQRYLSDASYSVLKERTDKFQQARINLVDNLKEAEKQGVPVNSICGSDLTYSDYDYNFLGIVASTATCNSDGIVPVYSASMGATTVPTGTEFDGEYLSKADSKYISTYKSIDASTCAFPDNVWFFQKQHHEVGTNEQVMELLSRIVTGEITDINSNPDFSQFLFSRKTKMLTRWLFNDAEKVFANAEGKYTDSQIAKVKTAYDNAKAVLADYTNTPDAQVKIDKATEDMVNVLDEIGARDKEKESAVEPIANKAITGIDNAVFSIYGDNGYWDWTHIGKLNGKIVNLFR